MKFNLKKLAGIVLAAVMLLALAAPAFAAGEETGDTPAAPATAGTITIENTKKDAKYDIYRIFDATVNGTNVSYTISEKWEAFFAAAAAGAGYIVDEKPADKDYNPITVDSTTKYIAIDNDNVVAFADAALNFALATDTAIAFDKQITGTGATVTEPDMPFGYYLTYMEGASEQTSDSNGSICSLTPVSADATLKIKATTPTIDKKAGQDGTLEEVSVDVGAVVPFTITGKVPDTGNFTSYTYKVSDTMTEGLTFNKDVVVTIGDEVQTAGDTTYAVTYPEDVNGFELNVYVMNYQDHIGAEIKIQYSATVNSAAVTADAQKNNAKLTYSNDPNDGETSVEAPGVEVDVYTSKIEINKTNSAGEPLADATFVLMNDAGKYYSVAADGVVTWVDTEEAATKVTSGEDGKVVFAGLKDGVYDLVETEAPAGYNKLAQPVAITVDGTKKDYKVEDGVNIPWDPAVDEAVGSTATKADGQVRFLTVTKGVENLTGAELPETGGMGTTLFYVIGGLLVVGAGVLLITKKRMSAE